MAIEQKYIYFFIQVQNDVLAEVQNPGTITSGAGGATSGSPMQPQLGPRDIEIALLHGALGVSSAQTLTILSMADFGKALKKVLEHACCGNLWKRELISDY
jgi:hypothetical protein